MKDDNVGLVMLGIILLGLLIVVISDFTWIVKNEKYNDIVSVLMILSGLVYLIGMFLLPFPGKTQIGIIIMGVAVTVRFVIGLMVYFRQDKKVNLNYFFSGYGGMCILFFASALAFSTFGFDKTEYSEDISIPSGESMKDQ